MKKLALYAALIAVLIAAGLTGGNIVANYRTAPNTSADPDVRFSAIVRLVRDNHTFCTGTVVSPNLIITAAHCVLMETPFGMMMNPTIEIRPSQNIQLNTVASVVYASVQMDQAMLTGDFRRYQFKPMITNPEKLAIIAGSKARFISCGYPLNGELFCNPTNFDKMDNFFWAVNGVLIPGMSGGPTMLPDGTLVAVNVAVQGVNSIVSPIYNITKNLGGK